MPRFVLLRHECPPGYVRPSHWDLMLESGGALRTWALLELPARGRAVEAEALGDHRLAYLEIEGELSGGRGTVNRDDAGTYEIMAESEKRLTIVVYGEKLNGRLALERIDAAGQRWRVSLED